MSKKKIFLIITLILVIVGAYVGSIAYSGMQISANVGDANVTPQINNIGNLVVPEYVGYILISIPIEIKNGGLYSIKNLQINIEVFSLDWEISNNLNGDRVGTGENLLGDIGSGTTWSGNIEVNITKNIPNFAVEDCLLEIKVKISLIYQPIIDIPLAFDIAQEVLYQAPF